MGFRPPSRRAHQGIYGFQVWVLGALKRNFLTHAKCSWLCSIDFRCSIQMPVTMSTRSMSYSYTGILNISKFAPIHQCIRKKHPFIECYHTLIIYCNSETSYLNDSYTCKYRQVWDIICLISTHFCVWIMCMIQSNELKLRITMPHAKLIPNQDSNRYSCSFMGLQRNKNDSAVYIHASKQLYNDGYLYVL